MSCQIEHMFEFEYYFNILKHSLLTNNLSVKKVVKCEEGNCGYFYIEFSFEVSGSDEYERLKSMIMDCSGTINHVSFTP